MARGSAARVRGRADDLIDAAKSKASEGDLAVLNDPALSPLLKIHALQRTALTDAQAKLLGRIRASDPNAALTNLVHDVLGPEAGNDRRGGGHPRQPLGELDGDAKVADTAGQLTAIGNHFRMVEAGGSHTPEVLTVLTRLDDYQARAQRPWRTEPVHEPPPAIPDEVRTQRAQRETATADVERAKAELQQAQARRAAPPAERSSRR